MFLSYTACTQLHRSQCSLIASGTSSLKSTDQWQYHAFITGWSCRPGTLRARRQVCHKPFPKKGLSCQDPRSSSPSFTLSLLPYCIFMQQSIIHSNNKLNGYSKNISVWKHRVSMWHHFYDVFSVTFKFLHHNQEVMWFAQNLQKVLPNFGFA